jgi:hypothetical protein
MVSIMVIMQSQSDLLEMVRALGSLGGGTSLLDG